jgi:polysaccharide export outer membrane protein
MRVVKVAVLLGIAMLAWVLQAQTGEAEKSADTKTQARGEARTEAKTDPANEARSDKAAEIAPDGNPTDYVIGADDTLRISVWKEPDLTETLPVRPDGKISMPLLNDIPAAGLTPLQLKDSITQKLKKYIADPRVTVVVTAMNSRRFFVTGEVLHSGPMTLLPNMTMLQALSQAGFTQFANLKAIYLLRMENGKQEKLPFNYREVIKGNHPEQNISLKPGDTVVVP